MSKTHYISIDQNLVQAEKILLQSFMRYYPKKIRILHFDRQKTYMQNAYNFNEKYKKAYLDYRLRPWKGTSIKYFNAIMLSKEILCQNFL